VQHDATLECEPERWVIPHASSDACPAEAAARSAAATALGGIMRAPASAAAAPGHARASVLRVVSLMLHACACASACVCAWAWWRRLAGRAALGVPALARPPQPAAATPGRHAHPTNTQSTHMKHIKHTRIARTRHTHPPHLRPPLLLAAAAAVAALHPRFASPRAGARDDRHREGGDSNASEASGVLRSRLLRCLIFFIRVRCPRLAPRRPSTPSVHVLG
jgi:hypothetical protein